MDGLLNFSVAFVLVVFAVVVLMGKADALMAKYRLSFKDGKPRFVKYREFDAKRARPLFALIFLVLAVFLVLEYIFRPIPEWYALIILTVALPVALYVEFNCRKKD